MKDYLRYELTIYLLQEGSDKRQGFKGKKSMEDRMRRWQEGEGGN